MELPSPTQTARRKKMSYHAIATASEKADGLLVWLLLSDKLGDNIQARLVAQASGLDLVEKRILMADRWIFGKPGFRPRIDHVDQQKSDPIEPPWPDAIITIGSRPSMVALWVREQSGGKTRIIQIGRAKRQLSRFDLVVAAPQYEIQEADNVVRLALPLVRADQAKIHEARARWYDRLHHLPRPITGLLIGGPTNPYSMPGQVIEKALSKLRRLNKGGTIYITTSRRTPRIVVETLKRLSASDTVLFDWEEGKADNPYFGLLAHADRFAVTADSVSMMMEVADIQKPLSIIELPLTRNLSTLGLFLARRLAKRLDPKGRFGSPRDLTHVQKRLIERGSASTLENGFPAAPFDGLESELKMVGERVRATAALKRA